MSEPQYNHENRVKVANACIDAWDLESLQDFALGQLVKLYEQDRQAFESDYEAVMPPDEPEEDDE